MRIRIATRQSKLALAQTGLVAESLSALGHECELVPLLTIGDKKQGTPAARVGDKRDWIHDLEVALLENRADIAIHSGKDVPAAISPNTELRAVLVREDPRDVFIGKVTGTSHVTFAAVEAGMTIGTASLRRRAQVLALGKGCSVAEVRGNVPTRLQKLQDDPSLSGIILAAAGIHRLGLSIPSLEFLPFTDFLPAVNQGILTVQTRTGEQALLDAIALLIDKDTEARFNAERGCVERLEGDCDSAIGIYAEVSGENLTLRSCVLLPDGSRALKKDLSGPKTRARAIGQELGDTLLSLGAAEILEKSREMRSKIRDL